ncbi:pyridoxamine 5'-phosphate oxidase family protein [Roseomonas terrae]|uniref:Pyridoxamine 5'-phosphate oxidase family protein n=1 Tax=Neoroseomonas terrae TaxID=424799 RepID=A0ABS5EMT8_9PROT|nr:pyridoxamine 5'-phosphate oxidase family protein [Neoroseomonas terrae]MBR0652349.1 pyridoxamine 5'-phosphate oxidase family protein [Neoroseomonas terrae]
MDRDKEIEAKFWKELRSDMTVMLGVRGTDRPVMRPMTAQLDGDDDKGPLWFFTAKDNDIVENVRGGTADGVISFASKGHGVFALVQGKLSVQKDRAVIDRLWNRFVAAWYEGGKDDPKLTMLRFDPADAEIWLNESSIFAGIKLLLGMDPKKEYGDKVAEVKLT